MYIGVIEKLVKRVKANNIAIGTYKDKGKKVKGSLLLDSREEA
jgi:hypothetical protein